MQRTLRFVRMMLLALVGHNKAHSFMSIGKPTLRTWSANWGLMANHYSTIGFASITTPEDMVDFSKHIAEDSATVKVPAVGGFYLRRSLKCGAELWSGVNEQNEVLSFNPHFKGDSQIRVGITSKLQESLLEGGFKGWANPDKEDHPESGWFQLEFDCPNYAHARMHNLVIPTIATVQIAAFAHEIEIFDSIQDYETSNENSDHVIEFASQSFAPASVFEKDETSFAVFTGHIAEVEMKENELTGNSFYWVRVLSLGDSQFDVVIDPELVSDEHPPQAGGVVKGYFWLSGRLVASDDTTD